MNKRFFLAALAAVALTLGFTSCSDEEVELSSYKLTIGLQFNVIGNEFEESYSIYKCYANTLGVNHNSDGDIMIEGKDSLDCINKILNLCDQAHEKLSNETWNNVTSISVIAGEDKVFTKKYGAKADNDCSLPEAVDLGLPSGTLWASFNVGLNNPSDICGLSYRFHVRDTDHATEALGDNWCTPTKKQMEELISSDRVYWKWKKPLEDGIIMPGYKIISKENGNSIFLPAINGVYLGTEGVSNDDYIGTGCYLTSTNAYPDVWKTLDYTKWLPNAIGLLEMQTGYTLCFTEEKISIGITTAPLNKSSNYLYPLRAVRK